MVRRLIAVSTIYRDHVPGAAVPFSAVGNEVSIVGALSSIIVRTDSTGCGSLLHHWGTTVRFDIFKR